MHFSKNLQIFGLNVSSLWRSLERNQNVWLSMNLITLFYFLYLLQGIVLTCKGCTQSANEHRACKLDLSATVRVRKQEGRIYGLAYTEYVCMLRSHKHTATGTLAHSQEWNYKVSTCRGCFSVLEQLSSPYVYTHTHARAHTSIPPPCCSPKWVFWHASSVYAYNPLVSRLPFLLFHLPSSPLPSPARPAG